MSIITELLEFAFIIIIAIIVVKERKKVACEPETVIDKYKGHKHFLVVASQIQITPILIDGE
jgi:hypothetical protein